MLLTASVLVFLSSATANAQYRFPDPTSQQTEQARRSGPCRDPWVTIAVYASTAGTKQIAGAGDFGECNPALYNGGSWNGYNDLHYAVEKALRALSNAGVTISMTSLGGDRRQLIIDGGGGYKSSTVLNIMINNGANLISNDGSSLVAAGAGNFRVKYTGTEKRINLGKSVLVIRKQ